MKNKIIWLLVSSFMTLSLVLASCGPAEEEEEEEVIVPEEEEVIVPEEEEEEAPPVEEKKWWVEEFGEPQYGDRLTGRLSGDVTNFDPYKYGINGWVMTFWLEHLGKIDWTIDRKIYSFKMRDYSIILGLGQTSGLLAESWEEPDPQTVIIHVRKGVRYQDKPPMNGREFNAYDVEYHWHRLLGLGSGFTEPSPHLTVPFWMRLKSVTAIDKYTVRYWWEAPMLDRLTSVLDDFSGSYIEPREVVEKYGDCEDWRNAVGTGPYILEDYVSGGALTLSKNPNYWQFDERYPENKLPYADMVKLLIIPDESTALAALRTAKIDLIENVLWEQAKSLAKTNPELVQIPIPTSAQAIGMRVDAKPFSDIRVRKALQKAIDIKTIAETYYGGTAEAKPFGRLGVGKEGAWGEQQYTLFDEWPEEVKQGYTYDPEGAKKLLAEAGYPEGFKTNIVASSMNDVSLLQIAQAYFAEIGVDMEIKTMESTVAMSYLWTGKHDAMFVTYCGGTAPTNPSMASIYSNSPSNYWHNNDPVFDNMYKELLSVLEWPVYVRLGRKMDDYYIAQQWTLVLVGGTYIYRIHQPWLKGWLGEGIVTGDHYAHMWVNQDVKKSMGY